jgi:hypothetical protein
MPGKEHHGDTEKKRRTTKYAKGTKRKTEGKEGTNIGSRGAAETRRRWRDHRSFTERSSAGLLPSDVLGMFPLPLRGSA